MGLSGQIRIFQGATAIVTGGASGIGRALSMELAGRGCEVTLADLQDELAETVAGEIRTAGGRARAVVLDVTDGSAVEAVIKETVARSGRLDYLFNNAGIGIGGNLEHHSLADWHRIVDVNLNGVIHGVQAAYPVMQAQGFGHIVNTASVAGLGPCPGMVSYGTTKYAVVGLSKSLRPEAARLSIRVSVFCPGFIRTPILDRGGKYGKMLTPLSEAQEKHMLAMMEKFRPMAPEQFAVKALDAVAKNKAVIIIPAWWNLVGLLHSLFPTLGLQLARKSFDKMQREIEQIESA